MNSSRETPSGWPPFSHSVLSQHSVLVGRVAKEKQGGVALQLLAQSLRSIDDSARGALPRGQDRRCPGGPC